MPDTTKCDCGQIFEFDANRLCNQCGSYFCEDCCNDGECKHCRAPMKLHKIKIHTDYWKEIVFGRKKAEIRYNDRDYQVGDILELHEVNQQGATRQYANGDMPIRLKITHIHSGLGMKDGYVTLSFNKIKQP